MFIIVVAAAALLISVTAPTSGAQDTALPEDFLITLERTCEAGCRVYSVTIDATGNVTYEGTKYVRVEGRRTDRVPVARVAAILETVDRIGFFGLRDHYRVIRHADGTATAITHLTTTFVTVRRHGRSKRVEDYLGAPGGLRELERLIDETARTKRWFSLDEAMLRQMILDGWSPSEEEKAAFLNAALLEDDVGVVKGLLEIGADPNASLDNGSSLPLREARSAAAVRALLDAGANPLATPERGALLSRVPHLPSEVAEVLVKAGAPVDHPIESDGVTPLWSAACQGNAGAVAVLLKTGANPRIVVRELSALDCASKAKASDVRRRPLPGDSPFLGNFDGVIAILEHALASRKDR